MRNRKNRNYGKEQEGGNGQARKKVKFANLYLRETDRGEFLVGSLGATELHLYWNDRKEDDDDPEASLYVVQRSAEQFRKWAGRGRGRAKGSDHSDRNERSDRDYERRSTKPRQGHSRGRRR